MFLYYVSNIIVLNLQILESDSRLDFGKALPYILQFYDNEVSLLIRNKYGYSIMDSYKKFLYQMLCNPELEMWEFSPNRKCFCRYRLTY